MTIASLKAPGATGLGGAQAASTTIEFAGLRKR